MTTMPMLAPSFLEEETVLLDATHLAREGWVVTDVEKDYPGSSVQNGLQQEQLDSW